MMCKDDLPSIPPVPSEGEAFQQFYREQFSPIYRFIYSKVGNREEAEDLTSQVFLKAVRGLDSRRELASKQSWLFQVARTTVADYWRSYYGVATASLEELMTAGWQGPTDEEPAEPDSTPAERVQHILEALPQRYRDVLTCRFLRELSVRETANTLGLTQEYVKVLQFRALKRAADLEQSGTLVRHRTPAS
jgi:RNA polymerase sigma-70 factor (ECF subfamily)